MTTIELIKTIEKRAGMYVDAANFESIHIFLSAFYFCKTVHQINELADDVFANEFYHWVKAKYHLENNESWSKLILLISENNDAVAYSIFFRLVNEFVIDKNIARP